MNPIILPPAMSHEQNKKSNRMIFGDEKQGIFNLLLPNI